MRHVAELAPAVAAGDFVTRLGAYGGGPGALRASTQKDPVA